MDPVSRAGVFVGTPAYMAPEQARGKLVDKRADIWAFGVILFEMLTGERLFDGETVSDTLIEVATREPPWERIPAQARRLLRRCLEKDPERRLRDIGDAWAWLEDWPEDTVTARERGRWRVPVALAVVAGLMAAAFAVGHYTRGVANNVTNGTIRISFAPPFKAASIGPAVSPDGRYMASSDVLGPGFIWLSSIDSSNAQKLQGTEGAMSVFWSPDGRSLGFVGDNRLQRLDLNSPASPPRTLASPANSTSGGAWSPEGIILFQAQQAASGLSRVSAGGGPAAPATRLNAARKEIVHRYPQFLPDGRHFIYWVWSAIEENTGEYIGSLDPAERLPEGPLVRTWREAHYADPGYLLYMEGAVLVARPFDPSRLRFTGEPRALPERIGRNWETTGRATFSTSATGALVYSEALPQPGTHIVLRGRNGDVLRTIDAPPGARWASLDPRGTYAAIQGENENTVEDLWMVDLERAIASPLTARQGSDEQPIWSPDGRRIAFMSNRAGAYDLYAKNADSGEDELLLRSAHTKWPVCWSADGKFLVYTESDKSDTKNTWVLPLEGDRRPIPFLNGAFDTNDANLSPVPDNQGRLWMAYSSNETGSNEVYLRSFLPGAPAGSAGAAVRVSPDGGRSPFWRKDAKELFYLKEGSWQEMAVDVKLEDTPKIGMPHELFHTVHPGVTADGRRFLTIEPAGDPPAARITVVLNWAAELTGK